MVGVDTYLLFILVFFLICLAAFVAASETAMMSINRYRLQHWVKKGDLNAARVKKLLERPDRLLGVIQLIDNFSDILVSAIVTFIAIHLWGDIGVLISTIILTLIILIFGKTLPKTVAALYPQQVAFKSSVLLKFFLIALYPLVWLINFLANGCLHLFGIKVKDYKVEPLSAEELRTLIREASGKISSSYQKILLRVLSSGQMSVDDLMIPRSEIYGIDITDEWDVILNKLTLSKHSYLPIYRENIDHVLGMLSLRQLLVLLPQGNLNKDKLVQLANEIHFIPSGTLLNRQLLNFQREGISIGLVVDEYGDIEGLITLENILEELVGEFSLDLDDTSRLVQACEDGSYLVDARINLRDLNRLTQWKFPVEGPKTLSGLIIEYLEMIPAAGLSLRLSGYPLEVLETSGNMVRLVRIWPKLFRDVRKDESPARD